MSIAFDRTVDLFLKNPPTDPHSDNPGTVAFYKGLAGDCRPGDYREGSWLHAAYTAGRLINSLNYEYL